MVGAPQGGSLNIDLNQGPALFYNYNISAPGWQSYTNI